MMSPQMSEMITHLKEKFDMVIFDTPPLLSISDAVPLVGQVDNVVLLVRQGETTSSELESGLRVLQSSSAKLTCTVLSMSTKQKGEGFEYY